jgi:hypothetical protein
MEVNGAAKRRPLMDVRDFEASSSDLDANGDEPIFVTRRSTGADAIEGSLRLEHRELRVSIHVLDPSLSQDDVVALFVLTYLRTLTADHYRDLADRVAIIWADGSRTVSFNYPN